MSGPIWDKGQPHILVPLGRKFRRILCLKSTNEPIKQEKNILRLKAIFFVHHFLILEPSWKIFLDFSAFYKVMIYFLSHSKDAHIYESEFKGIWWQIDTTDTILDPRPSTSGTLCVEMLGVGGVAAWQEVNFCRIIRCKSKVTLV